MKAWEDCDLGYEEMQRKRCHNEISEEAFYEWYMMNCEMCPFMHEICLYGDILPDGSIFDENFLIKSSLEDFRKAEKILKGDNL